MSALVLSALMLVTPAVQAADSLFRVEFEEGAIVRLERRGGDYDTDYIREGRRFGDVTVRSRAPGGAWTTPSTAPSGEADTRTVQQNPQRGTYAVVAEDPIFGLTAFGGTLDRGEETVRVVPRDGVRRRFHVLRDGRRFHLTLRYDRLAADRPVMVAEDLSRVRFTVENVNPGTDHVSTLRISGLPDGHYAVDLDGKTLTTFASGDGSIEIPLPITGATHPVVLRRIE